MAKLGAQNINDASIKAPRRTVTHKGERRLEVLPPGMSERFVDPTGNVMGIMLASRGAPSPQADALRERNARHVDGFVEYDKCPLRSGARFVSKAIENDFAEMPQTQAMQMACADDPVTLTRHSKNGFEAHDSCQHVEWLIGFRRQKANDDNANRNASRVIAERAAAEVDELRKVQLEMAKEQLASQRAKRDGHGNPAHDDKGKTK